MSAQCKALATSKLSWEVMTHNFLAVVDEAHQLKLSHPRNPINPRFGLELAALSLENKRLADAVAWLWNTKPHVATDSTATQPTAAETQSIVKFAVLFSQTGFARKIVQSAFLRRCAKWLLRKMA
jgi:N6-adenosine-specific RNA methylase IME4